eukprot:1181367-Prorocentrum_minimum.AAC.4
MPGNSLAVEGDRVLERRRELADAVPAVQAVPRGTTTGYPCERPACREPSSQHTELLVLFHIEGNINHQI